MNNMKSSTDSDSSNEEYNINDNNIRNNIVNNSNSIDSENRNINISDSENNSIITNNEDRVNISNFMCNECVNIYVRWYRLYNFLLGGGRDTEIIDLNYKKEWIILFKNQNHFW